ncbi:MAG: aldo/keto reductase [bacterium]|nr:aldo/keto reductase [bacterium]
MELRSCRTSGLQLSILGLGCWEFGGGAYWGESDQKNVTNIVHKAVDLGMNYFDVAELYNEGRSEEFLGKALIGIARDKVVVGSKIWPTNMHPQHLREHCEASLQRLNMDYLDLYMIHWPLTPRTYPMFADTAKAGIGGEQAELDAIPALDEALGCLVQLQREGKIRHLGLSNYGVERMKEIRASGADFAVNQVVYNLLTRAAEMEILPYCEQVGTGVIAYMVLMQGLLTDRYATLEDVPDWYTRTRHFDSKRNPKSRHGEAGFETEITQVLQELRAIAQECGYSSADLAFKWAVAAKGITCALLGTQNLNRLEHNVQTIQEELSAEILERLNMISLSLKEKLGSSLDVFESVEHDRTR